MYLMIMDRWSTQFREIGTAAVHRKNRITTSPRYNIMGSQKECLRASAVVNSSLSIRPRPSQPLLQFSERELVSFSSSLFSLFYFPCMGLSRNPLPTSWPCQWAELITMFHGDLIHKSTSDQFILNRGGQYIAEIVNGMSSSKSKVLFWCGALCLTSFASGVHPLHWNEVQGNL